MGEKGESTEIESFDSPLQDFFYTIGDVESSELSPIPFQ